MKRNFLPYLLLLIVFVQANTGVLSAFGSGLVTQDTFFIQTSNCTQPATVCIDIPSADIGNYDLLVDGVMYAGGTSACTATGAAHYDYSTLFGQGNLGPYMVNDWEVNSTLFSGSFFNITALVDSMNTWDPTGNWALEESNLSIVGGNPNFTYTQMDITVVTISSPTFIAWNTGTTTPGTLLSLDVGTHEVIVTETGGGLCVDTFYVEAYCVVPNTIELSIEESNTGMYCFDNAELPGQVSTVQMYCPNSSGTYVDFQLIANNTCAEYTALSPGVDSSCYVICDNFGICDTTILKVTVTASPSSIEWLYDTVVINMNNSVCIDTSQLNGNLVSIINDCPTSSGLEVLFDIDTNSYCVSYDALDIGQDTACIHVMDDLGKVDTTYLVVTVRSPNTEYINASLEVGMMDTWCIDSTELEGNVITFENICENTTGTTTFALNDLTLCIEAQANNEGIDTACIVLCDDLGICDSTFLVLSITETTTSKPIANDDAVSVLKDEDIVINICENDSIFNGLLTNNYILPVTAGGPGPNYGFAIFNDDCTITYSPVGEPCDIDDSFQYVICNAQGCDTALVTVTIDCFPQEELMFSNGFSPNGDDVNDFFKIVGAENMPNNELYVFNRWGNQVYSVKGYQNDWNGSWEGSILQNGTYFYVFMDGAGNDYAGYVYIRR